MGARSPMIWDEGQAERLLAGSPVVQLIQERSKVMLQLHEIERAFLESKDFMDYLSLVANGDPGAACKSKISTGQAGRGAEQLLYPSCIYHSHKRDK